MTLAGAHRTEVRRDVHTESITDELLADLVTGIGVEHHCMLAVVSASALDQSSGVAPHQGFSRWPEQAVASQLSVAN